MGLRFSACGDFLRRGGVFRSLFSRAVNLAKSIAPIGAGVQNLTFSATSSIVPLGNDTFMNPAPEGRSSLAQRFSAG